LAFGLFAGERIGEPNTCADSAGILRENFRDDSLFFHSGQTLVQSLEFISESLVVDAHAVQDCGVQIVDVHGIFRDVVAEIVGLTEGHATLDSTASHPHAKIPRLVLSAIVVLGQATLAVDSPPELTSPDDQRVLEHPSAFKVLDQGGDGLIGLLALVPNLPWQIAVLVPSAMEQLNDSHTSLDEAAG